MLMIKKHYSHDVKFTFFWPYQIYYQLPDLYSYRGQLSVSNLPL